MIDPNVKAQLASYRQSIDNIDAALVHMLAERFRCTKEVGVLKAKYKLPPPEHRSRQGAAKNSQHAVTQPVQKAERGNATCLVLPSVRAE